MKKIQEKTLLKIANLMINNKHIQEKIFWQRGRISRLKKSIQKKIRNKKPNIIFK